MIRNNDRNNIFDIIPSFRYNPLMNYCTTKEIAKKWNVSDRRVRILCREGRVPGVIIEGGTYLIPFDAIKPEDKRYRKIGKTAYSSDVTYSYVDARRNMVREAEGIYSSVEPILYMKWEDDIIAQIDSTYSVYFTQPEYNKAVVDITGGQRIWDRNQFEAFLRDRIVSRDRRDIEKILFRCGLSSYDVIKIAIATKAISAADMIWITDNPSDSMQSATSDVFDSIFLHRIDAEGDSIDSPAGFNIKRYGVYNGAYGIYKKRISPVTTDAESELAVNRLADLMGVPCCRTYRVDDDTIFSCFEYDFSKEYIVHVRRLYEARESAGFMRDKNEYLNLLSIRPEYQADYIRMIALDFVTRQDDRHLSNIAVKISGEEESFYPLYDNGRSLFYEDTEETSAKAVRDIRKFSTAFGAAGSYYDHVTSLAENGTVFSRLLNLDMSESQIRKILKESYFKDYRLDASLEWICKTLEILRKI